MATTRLYAAVNSLVELEMQRTKLDQCLRDSLEDIISYPTNNVRASAEFSTLQQQLEELLALEEDIFEQRRMVCDLKSHIVGILVEMKEQDTTEKQLTQFYTDSFFTPDQVMQPLLEVEKWELDANDVQLGEQLGAGAFGTVRKGVVNGKEVACKQLHTSALSAQALEDFRNEVVLMCRMRHPNLLMLMGVCTIGKEILMVTELMTKGSVADALKDPSRPLNLDRKISIAKDVALGMNWLHKLMPPILHLDLKPANILLSDTYSAKVADFGLSKAKTTIPGTGSAGSPIYMAPEVLLGSHHIDESADVYSFGMILYELETEVPPFQTEVQEGLITGFESLRDLVSLEKLRPKVKPGCSRVLIDIMNMCWADESAHRPSFQILIDSKLLDQAKLPQDDVSILLLKQLLAKKDAVGLVTLEHFGRMLEYIGPVTIGLEVFRNLRTLCLTPGFVGDMPTAEAEKTLAGHKDAAPGMYLIRFSQSDPGGFAVTALSQTKNLRHWRISHRTNGSDSTHTRTLSDLIKNAAKDPSMSLGRPLPNCPYETIARAAQAGARSYGYGTLDQSSIASAVEIMAASAAASASPGGDLSSPNKGSKGLSTNSTVPSPMFPAFEDSTGASRRGSSAS